MVAVGERGDGDEQSRAENGGEAENAGGKQVGKSWQMVRSKLGVEVESR